jgi:hypothetical protein
MRGLAVQVEQPVAVEREENDKMFSLPAWTGQIKDCDYQEIAISHQHKMMKKPANFQGLMY